MNPVKEPRDELRVEPAKQRTQTDKYVTVLETGTANTEVDFNTQSLLPMSADHYKVGVDELVVSLSNLSIIEQTNEVLFEIRPVTRTLNVADQGQTELSMDHVLSDHTVAGAYESAADYAFTCNRIYRNTLDIKNRLDEIAFKVNAFIESEGFFDIGGAVAGHPAIEWCRTNYAAANLPNKLTIDIGPNGQLTIKGPQIFWANFFIYVPLPKFQSIIFGTTPSDSISIDPLAADGGIRHNIAEIVTHNAANGTFSGIAHANVGPGQVLDDTTVKFSTAHSFLANVNRIVAVELSTSLPLKHSPLIDHQSLPSAVTGTRGEIPDYALGRFHVNFQPKISLSGGQNPTTSFETTIGPQILTGLQSRVCYHHLRPQERIAQMRVKLWARVRTFKDRKWFMSVILCPMGPMDYWSAKLHFITKHKHQY